MMSSTAGSWGRSSRVAGGLCQCTGPVSAAAWQGRASAKGRGGRKERQQLSLVFSVHKSVLKGAANPSFLPGVLPTRSHSNTDSRKDKEPRETSRIQQRQRTLHPSRSCGSQADLNERQKALDGSDVQRLPSPKGPVWSSVSMSLQGSVEKIVG